MTERAPSAPLAKKLRIDGDWLARKLAASPDIEPQAGKEDAVHQLMVVEIIKHCRARDTQGDCPTLPALAVETLEFAILEMARRQKDNSSAAGAAPLASTAEALEAARRIAGLAPSIDAKGAHSYSADAELVARALLASRAVPLAILEEAAQWMIARSYATGPGDTVSDLMAELVEQVRENTLKAAQKVGAGEPRPEGTPNPVVPLQSPSEAAGALLTGEELMDEMDAYVSGCGGNPLVAKAIRDAFEGRGLSRDKGVLIHAVWNDLKVEAVMMYRRVEPKQTPKPKAEGST